ncbi:hypothetical protein PGTUg99_031054 [Puccinia graminis f. sp. tritici]|uniref:Uncharacterized protein n=1 Tax=Puccinia graminis f. sp. tritici TaxID=56615 RepID=A0A5B0S7Q9_PUCGR|nr:hypothetical protein PGTUg99_031054 [Puccinia graminis f. sp. tritici]
MTPFIRRDQAPKDHNMILVFRILHGGRINRAIKVQIIQIVDSTASDNRYSRAILNLPQKELTSFFNTFLFLQQHINHVGDVGRKASAELHHGASFLKLAPSAGRFPEESVQRMRSERPRDALASQHHLDASKSIQVTLAKYEASDGR